MKRVAIIGAGITGLTTAWSAKQAGAEVRVLESAAEVGGAMRTVREAGFQIELGPNTLQVTSAGVLSFLEKLGLKPLESSAEARNRYIVRGGRPVAAPLSPLGFIASPLFSARAKLRLFAEPFIRAPKATEDDESLASFVRRRLGEEFLTRAINAFVAGVYAGSPEQLSVRHGFPRLYALERDHGSLIRGAIAKKREWKGTDRIKARLVSFANGLHELPLALAASLGSAVETSAVVRSVGRTEQGWSLSWSARGGERTEVFDAVVLAVPAYALSGLPLPRPLLAQLQPLGAIPHPPISVLALGFDRAQVAHPLDGFGALVPEIERLSILGTLFSSSLYGHRAPDGKVCLTTFIGGTRQPELAGLETGRLVEVALGDLRRLLGVQGAPCFIRHILWPRSIPQYTCGYGRYLTCLEDAERQWPGLHVAGNFRGGISAVQCLQNGLALGERLAK